MEEKSVGSFAIHVTRFINHNDRRILPLSATRPELETIVCDGPPGPRVCRFRRPTGGSTFHATWQARTKQIGIVSDALALMQLISRRTSDLPARHAEHDSYVAVMLRMTSSRGLFEHSE